ncbi:MAG TPA: erythromycin esterase family protein [Chloroflexota bacterium]|nr:erythromycin esterase family protein [Chloroflexota bacterium]
MRTASSSELVDTVRAAARPLAGTAHDYDPLLDLVGDRRFVLLGEASHGTREFYQMRAEITRRLIEEKGFTAVAVEADWPDAYRVNCYVRGQDDDGSAAEALGGFRRFPTWMWRNTVVRDFVEWLRQYNAALPPGGRPVGFYGLDLYSLYTSIEAVIAYLDKVDPAAAREARERYACFEQFGEDRQAYGWATGIGLTPSCEQEAVRQLVALQRHAADYLRRDGRAAEDAYFYAEQNARLVHDAEQYYRTMGRGRVESWNLRDCHMADTLDALVAHLTRRTPWAKIVVWEHNSHLGDARATELGQRGELNVGQVVRTRYDDHALLVGFSTYEGTVTAAPDWDAPAERKRVRPALPDSYEALFHAAGCPRFLLTWQPDDPTARALEGPLLERAIGVIYRPATERQSHYFYARLPEQFDAVLHVDQTSAVEPLERTAGWEAGEVPETYPSAL